MNDELCHGCQQAQSPDGTCQEPNTRLSCRTVGYIRRTDRFYFMQPSPAKTWLNLLLVIAMVMGPWPVLSGTTTVDTCCMMSMETAAEAQHAGCGSQLEQNDCCIEQGCPGSHCSVTAFIPPEIHIRFSTHQDTFAASFGNSPPVGATAPPTPPPIV